ncbi:MAG: glucose-1-phosphate thymidylyltransferase [Nitrososphaerota archaeon]|nr:glucose-1-phosphate thymidylyltransferase [Nitrososphaerota archaeon]MDG6922694.1 glucose-1-phosphate thymidylyltransferase [Nitrososphaerota archaeon]
MKGLLLAGGHGTRLRPLTYTGNKHMLPIANKPMLLYGLEHLKNSGIRQVGIILGPVKEGVVETIGDGSKFGLEVTYIHQPNPLGLAHAVKVSQDYIGDEPFVMYLGDNLLRQGVNDYVRIFDARNLDCLVGVCPVKDPVRFGIAELDGRGRIIRLVEKPKEPKSNLALIGVYIFNSSIFDAVKRIKPSFRNELEITDAIQELVNENRKVEVERVSGWWKDTGKPEDLLEANQLVLSDLKTSINGEIEATAEVTGNFSLGDGSRILEGVSIQGPVIVGNNCTIGPDVYMGPYTAIGDNCTLKNAEIENSIVMNGSKIESSKRIVASLIGSNSTILSADTLKPKGYKLIIGERSFAQI